MHNCDVIWILSSKTPSRLVRARFLLDTHPIREMNPWSWYQVPNLSGQTLPLTRKKRYFQNNRDQSHPQPWPQSDCLAGSKKGKGVRKIDKCGGTDCTLRATACAVRTCVRVRACRGNRRAQKLVARSVAVFCTARTKLCQGAYTDTGFHCCLGCWSEWRQEVGSVQPNGVN